MPLVNLSCLNQHRSEVFVHAWADLGCETRWCACGELLAPAFSAGTTLTWFEEGRARVIHNLGDQPVVLTSHKQHQEAMRRAGVTQGKPRFMRGRKGYEV